MCGSWRDVNPASFDFRLVGTEGFRADMLHLHAYMLQKCGQSGRRDLIAHVRWNRAGEGLACSNIELGAVHRAGNDLAVEGNLAGQTHQRTFCGSVEEPLHLVALRMRFEVLCAPTRRVYECS